MQSVKARSEEDTTNKGKIKKRSNEDKTRRRRSNQWRQDQKTIQPVKAR